jgi:antitoxin (DNA-binding transcriptional repressor) of toxin-antitoxin stability system
MTVTDDVASAQLREILREDRAGNEVVITEKNEPVARVVAMTKAHEEIPKSPRKFFLETFPGKVLKPHFTHFEIMEEMSRRHDED